MYKRFIKLCLKNKHILTIINNQSCEEHIQKHVWVPLDCHHYFTDLGDGVRKVLAKRRRNREVWRPIISSLLVSHPSSLPTHLLPSPSVIFLSILPSTELFWKIGGHENGRAEALLIPPVSMSACSREGHGSGHSRSLESQATFTPMRDFLLLMVFSRLIYTKSTRP